MVAAVKAGDGEINTRQRLEVQLNTESNSQSNDSSQGRAWGYAALFAVALLWGSYTPALRYIYMAKNPPSPALLNAAQACLSAIFLISANLTAQVASNESPGVLQSNPVMAEDTAVRDALIKSDQQEEDQELLVCSIKPNEEKQPSTGNGSIQHALAAALNWRSDSLMVAGAEIGLWMCMAFGLEVAGVQLISATKAAFLNQVSVLITPLLVHLSGERVKGSEWLVCALGLLGSFLVGVGSFTSGGGGEGAAAAAEAAQHDAEVLGLLYVLCSALFFALSTVRLGRYSTHFGPLPLSTASTSVLGLASLGWLGVTAAAQPDGLSSQLALMHGMLSDVSCTLTLLWVGVGPGALAAFLQASGQKVVPPAQAQVIYSTTPLWAAACAHLVLDSSHEGMGGVAWAGASIMLLSSVLTAVLPAVSLKSLLPGSSDSTTSSSAGSISSGGRGSPRGDKSSGGRGSPGKTSTGGSRTSSSGITSSNGGTVASSMPDVVIIKGWDVEEKPEVKTK